MALTCPSALFGCGGKHRAIRHLRPVNGSQAHLRAGLVEAEKVFLGAILADRHVVAVVAEPERRALIAIHRAAQALVREVDPADGRVGRGCHPGRPAQVGEVDLGGAAARDVASRDHAAVLRHRGGSVRVVDAARIDKAMRLLALNYPEQAIKVLQAAINDSYELIRRFAAEYIEKNADPQLVPAFIQAYISRNHETRLMFKIQSGLSAFEPEVLLAEIDRQTKDKVFYNAAYVEQLKKQITNSAKGKQRDLETSSYASAPSKHLDGLTRTIAVRKSSVACKTSQPTTRTCRTK